MKNEVAEAALRYCKAGFSVIPIRPPMKGEDGRDEAKKPLIRWQEYQEKKATPQEIKGWFNKWPNARIAIVTGKISGLDAVDIDTRDGEDLLITTLDEEFFGFRPPTATTPRGGKHLFVKASGLGNATGFLEGVDYRGTGGYVIVAPSPGLNGKGYSWIKGASIFEVEPPELPAALRSLLNNNSLSIYEGISRGENKEIPNDHTKPQLTTTDHMNFNKGHRDNALFHLANHLVRGGMPPKEIEIFLRLTASKICSPPFPEKEIPAKIQSAINRAEMQERNIAGDVREWVLTTSGHFLTTDCHKDLQLTTRDHKKACTMALLRMVEEGLIEKFGDKRGCFRRVERGYEEIDLDAIEDTDPLNLRLPFRMETLIELMPKDLIVFGGTTNAGKTALLMETARLNMHDHRIFYFSTELGRNAAKKRLMKHETCKKWPFKFVDQIPNYYDIIHPDDINIVDYVEVEEGEYYKIPSILSGIQKRLKNGVAFVALQKNPGTSHGIGGAQTKSKPAVFCSLEEQYPGAVLKIEKGKNWATERNPNGLCHKYKIVNGINIISQGGWHR